MYEKVGKRLLDLLITVPLLVLVAPVMVVVGLAVWITMGRPILFKQQRPGLYGIPFTIYKFRTMTMGSDAAGNLLADQVRLTGFGRFLRGTSLDELPELLNVLRGDMSLVGPRPLLEEYLALYTAEQMRRHAVKPGITGWAQVNGRNGLTWEAKFAYDNWYVENVSFRLDLKILLITISKVLRRDGISERGHVTMSKFEGS